MRREFHQVRVGIWARALQRGRIHSIVAGTTKNETNQNREPAVGKAGRKRFNNYTRRYGATRRTQQPPLQQIVIGHTRKNRDDILRILDKHPNDYVKDPQRLLKNLLQTFSIDVDVHIPVELFQRINDIPALVSRLRWEPEFSATLEKIRDTNATLKLLLLPPNERTAYRERLRQ